MDDFVLLSGQRGPNLESAVEHFSKFWRFCSTFEAARPKFRQAGRQKRGISPVFCLLLDPHALNFDQPVDKKEAFLPFFVYFWYRAPRFRRTAEISPKQETLRRCLMPVALHFEFPSRKLSRFISSVPQNFPSLHQKRCIIDNKKSDPPLAVSDLDASLRQYLIFHADERVEFQVAIVEPHAGEFKRSTVVKKENTFHDAGRLCIFQTKKFLVTSCGRLGKNGEK